ncbi:flagellar export chaperone FliS [Imhoffiella purpurea]|uniref:Flagellar secretion chaperone FliS n=1 Tax=Imhoffiella purpurea TaxID=1249627 RepID=W9VBK2_9GAMM|nr:flagellar export chaperone FliS [Imhoffiella purpurea]EXJ13417.1 Flagellar biosynthesis protein FliS [Imhoffiella purpurea]
MYAMRRELQQYRQSGAMAEAETADPHRLIQMLFEGALERIAVAKGAMEQGNIQLKGNKLTQAIAIIGGLRSSLDHGKGADLAANLDSLYEYMTRRLLHANMRNDAEALDEVIGLLREIKSAWDTIPTLLRQAS